MSDQERIWDHFQNEQIDSFENSGPRLDYLLSRISKTNPESVSLLNVGIGNGFLERQALKQGYVVNSLDLSKQAVEQISKAGVKAYEGRFEDMPFEDACMDVIVASEVLEHLEDSQRQLALKEVKRVLKPGGIFLGTVPHCENLNANVVVCPKCGDKFHRWGHVKSYTPQALDAELSGQFSEVTTKVLAFVSFKRSLFGLLKSSVRWVLGRMGSPIANPNIYFKATK